MQGLYTDYVGIKASKNICSKSIVKPTPAPGNDGGAFPGFLPKKGPQETMGSAMSYRLSSEYHS